MKYRSDRYGNQLSQLGYGCMRFTRKGRSIDFEKAEREVMRAYELGVNYFDTAYIYPGSEECLGRILEKNGIREKVNVATKLPQYLLRTPEAVDKTFQEELGRLRTNYIDYYLMHMFTDYSEWEHLQSLGIEEWIRARKEEGRIRQVGFSYHGEPEAFIKILNAYDWDFCQIQYNYMDVNSQAGKRGLMAAFDKGIPVIIMEPLRGGKLVDLPKKALEYLKKNCFSAAELGLNWLWDQQAVTVVLSGMNSIEMVEENCRIASSAAVGMLSPDDFAIVDHIKDVIRESEKVGCTGCRYCMPCPQGVDIPGTFHFYNLMYAEKKSSARFEAARVLGVRMKPGYGTECIGCGKCESHCPQHLPIREKLKEADRALLPLHYKIGVAVARKVMLRRQ